MAESIYGKHKEVLPAVLKHLVSQIENYNETKKKETGEPAYEHLIYRIKSEDSMREKCQRKGLPPVPKSALYDIHDAIGIRIVCCFLNDIYDNIKFIESIPGAKVIVGKDYIKSAKPNGYRSFHMILRMDVPFEEKEMTLSLNQPFRNMEDARRFFRLYSQDKNKRAAAEDYLRNRLRETDDPAFPLELPMQRNLALITLNVNSL